MQILGRKVDGWFKFFFPGNMLASLWIPIQITIFWSLPSSLGEGHTGLLDLSLLQGTGHKHFLGNGISTSLVFQDILV